jgi:benzodiazapine receptor
MIGTSFALTWHQGHLGKTRPSFFFVLQFLLNLAWTPVFFGAQQIGTALLIIILLWLAIAATIREFARLSKPAAYLLIPYLIWVSYATYLNGGHFYLN